MNVQGLIIDPQRDFCDPQKGTLYVPGAETDMERLAALLRRIGTGVSALHVTLDSHHYRNIAHPVWWRDAAGDTPAPFTIISPQDIESGQWRAARAEDEIYSRDYVNALAAHGRYPLCIWPYHCLIGTPGHAVTEELFPALTEWEAATGNIVNFVRKGENPRTEHYSAIRADVPDPNDPATQVNAALIQKLSQAEVIFVAGEALSHCVANTVRDLIDASGDAALLQRLVLLTDACSSVTGFEDYADNFLAEMKHRGLQTAATTDL